jgi:hypothetical protein
VPSETVNCGALEPIRVGWLPRSHAVASKPHRASASTDRARVRPFTDDLLADSRLTKNLLHFCFQ